METTTRVFLKQVVDYVYAYYKLDGSCFRDKKRNANIVRARHVAIYIITTHSGWGSSEISRYFGLTHASSIHAVRKIKGYISYDKKLQDEITDIETGLSLAPNTTVRLSDTKQIILKGFTKKEIEEFMLINNPKETTIITLSRHDQDSQSIVQQHSEVFGRS